jgi:Pyruvate phosphate dikinase, AMP/ATP-binding domain
MEKFENISISAIYKRRKSDRDIFQELMPNKVKEVLLFATLYDSYTIEREGQFSDKIFGEYLQLNLYAAPRFTSVNTEEDVTKMLNIRHFDLAIVMAGVDKELPLIVVQEINDLKPRIPILLLVNNNSDVSFFKLAASQIPAIDRVFVWNGNSNVFLAMIKYIEDKKNVAKDTRLGGVRIILLVEDSIKYYSRYLPLLFTSVMTQTQALVSDESVDELHKIFKYRARPKVLLVSTYEDALEVINEYKDNLLSIISDVKFLRNGSIDDQAGFEILKYARKILRYPIPFLLQSHDISNGALAKEINAEFINKNSDTLSHDINHFINRNLGFGDFIFRNGNGEVITKASNLHEFEKLISTVPIESLVYHGKSNDFSTWLMARGEINMAERLIPYKIDDFADPARIRDICKGVFADVHEKRNRGRIVNFDPALVEGNRYILRLGLGSLGGKGRGLAFMSNLMENIDMKSLIPGINIRMPATAVIGAIEFDNFMEKNNLYEIVYGNTDFQRLIQLFLNGTLSSGLDDRLMDYIRQVKHPLAIRSSGLFEDSLIQPFSGVYATYLIPNNHPDETVRYEQLRTAVKLVYASVFSDEARSYFNAINYKIEEEKMAVVIQPVVGQYHSEKFYPDISGVAQSFNYYPYSHMEPEDGFAVIAMGLGQAVVGGEKAWRFCPKFPELKNNSVEDQIRDSQREFYAIDMTDSNFELTQEGELGAIKKFKISEAEKDGVLANCASTYSMVNDLLLPGLAERGARVINFANILEYQNIPLASTLILLMKLFKQAMGSPVELEFALDLTKGENNWPTFYLLQLKPLIRREAEVTINLDLSDRTNLLLLSTKGMGNGRISGISDVVYVDINLFDKTKTEAIAQEIALVNKGLGEQNRTFVLIGPGRWGTRDPFTGIPVKWGQINNAKVIVEIGLPDYPLEASLGSHFFHNVTSMNVGYFSIPTANSVDFIKFDLLNDQEIIYQGSYVKNVRFKQSLEILMDGRKQTALIQVI